jgi:hypothetical protein
MVLDHGVNHFDVAPRWHAEVASVVDARIREDLPG